MKVNRRAVRIGAVLFVAAAAGQLVQSGRDETQPVEVADVAPAAVPRNVTPVAAGPTEPVLPARAAILPKGPDLPGAALAPSPAATPVEAAVIPEPPAPVPAAPLDLADTCPTSLALVPQAGAMIGVSLLAPCHPEERVVLRHAGLAVTARTSASGAVTAELPALDAAGKVSVLFKDGSQASATLALPDLKGLQRFAVQWQGQDAFQLHAFEGGADYGQPGHVTQDNSRRPVPGMDLKGGWMVALGDASTDLPLFALVYTFPTTPGLNADVVVEAAISGDTCGRELLGETIDSTGGAATVTDLTVAMPDCDAIGDILVLKNLASDLKIAAAD